MDNAFRTILAPSHAIFNLTYQHSIFGLGSCFVSNIGDQLARYGYAIEVNPFGTVFHPQAMLKQLKWIVGAENVNLRTVERDETFFHYDTHSSVQGNNQEDLINNINNIINASKNAFQKADCVLLTFGTAFYYNLLEDGESVANCHKMPNKLFDKKIADVANTIDIYNEIFDICKSKNVIATISPVRHLKDGFVENNRSKSILIAALHEAIKSHDNVYYFPSYEIMMDDLRDYRFYDVDMVHPNEQGIKYVWENFKTQFLSKKAYQIMDLVDQIMLNLNHKPFNSGSEGYKKHVQKTENLLQLIPQEILERLAIVEKIQQIKSNLKMH